MAMVEAPNHAVLVVDDLRMNRLVLARMVKKLGFEVLEAENGLEALEVFWREKDRCAFVFMDLVMPFKDGYTTARELRQKEVEVATHRTPIVAYTAENKDNVINGTTVLNACIDSGMDGCLVKPVTLDVVMSVLRAHIPSYQPSAPGRMQATHQYAPNHASCAMLHQQARAMLSASSAANVASFGGDGGLGGQAIHKRMSIDVFRHAAPTAVHSEAFRRSSLEESVSLAQQLRSAATSAAECAAASARLNGGSVEHSGHGAGIGDCSALESPASC